MRSWPLAISPLWIPSGLLVGGASGALVGGVVMTAASFVPDKGPTVVSLTGGSAGDMLGFGLTAGGAWGAATGLAVGLVLMCAVVGHPSRDDAEHVARSTGTVTTFVVLGLTLLPLWNTGMIAASILLLGVLVSGPACASVARWVHVDGPVS